MRLGAHVAGDAVEVATYATGVAECAVRVWPGGETHPMRALGDGVFAARLAGRGAGLRYKLVLDGRELPDPYARWLPEGVHGAAEVVDSRYVWRHAPPPPRRLAEHVLYELHIGTFTPEGTYLGALARLDDVAALGATAIELMPLAAWNGSRGWGYDGVALFAPHAAYGTPDELRRLIDEAHGRGLAVLLDVVYNHLGPSGNYLASFSPDYFAPAVQTVWGAAPDFAHPPMRRLVVDNARTWLEEFRFDGLRLDATHAIVDPSPRHILRELAELVPGKLIIAEDERNDPRLVREQRLTAVWADDFHHALHATLTGERDGYYAAYEPGAATLARAIEGGWLYEGQRYAPWGKPRGAPAPEVPAEAFVYCIQNHDQVGNRAFGQRLSSLVSVDAYCAASALLLFLPMTPLLFMGQEWGATTPFCYFTDHGGDLGRAVCAGRREEFKAFAAFSDPHARDRIPDPEAESTFAASKLRWDEREGEDGRRVLALYRDLLALRRDDAVLAASGREGLSAEALGEVLIIRRRAPAGERLLAVNLGAEVVALASLPVGGRCVFGENGPSLAPHEARIFAR